MPTTSPSRPAAINLHFRVRGTPTPQGSKRLGRHGARAVILDDNDATLKVWRTEVAHAARAALGDRAPMAGPIAMDVAFFLPRPASHLTTKGALRSTAPERPAVKPDLDKLIRSTQDGIATDAKVIVEDSRIVMIRAEKHYGPPGAVVALRRMGAVS